MKTEEQIRKEFETWVFDYMNCQACLDIDPSTVPWSIRKNPQNGYFAQDTHYMSLGWKACAESYEQKLAEKDNAIAHYKNDQWAARYKEEQAKQRELELLAVIEHLKQPIMCKQCGNKKDFLYLGQDGKLKTTEGGKN